MAGERIDWDAMKKGGMQGKADWAALVGGGALAIMGLARRGPIGLPVAAAGLALMYQGATGRSVAPWRSREKKPVEVIASVTVRRSPDQLYGYWRDFRNLPIFMRHLRSVEQIGENRYHWVAEAPMVKAPIEWDSEITEERPGELIRWRSLPGSEIYHSGVVVFKALPNDRGTELHVAIEYHATGALAATAARVFGHIDAELLRDELRRFKQLMETGEVPTTAGQPSA